MNIEYSLRKKNTRRSGQSLVGLLVVIVIGIAIYMLFLGPRKGTDGERKSSVLKKSLDRAEDVNTTNNLVQIQTGINMFKAENERYPASLDEFKKSTFGSGYPAEMFVDSVSKQPFNYDPQTGQVSSPTGGLPGAPGSAPRNSNPGGVDLSGVPGANQ
jgi:hypothetical protein